jgi:release factor glutamine methyltransferase
MIWKEYLNIIAKELEKHLTDDIQYSGIPKKQVRQSAWREIEIFIENYKHWTQAKLILSENNTISTTDRTKLSNFIKARQKGQPLAYIIGKQTFYGIDIQVNRNVLIPRPETEELLIHTLKYLKNNSILVDIGTGSGCILTAILKNLPKNVKPAEIYAVDKSKGALSLAKKNITKNIKTKYKIKYLNTSLLPKINLDSRLLIVANLPYLSEKEYRALSPEVKSFEPRTALVGGIKGHELICQLIDQIYKSINKFDLLLEISPTVYPAIKNHLAGKEVKIKSHRDLSGKIRILHVIRQY